MESLQLQTDLAKIAGIGLKRAKELIDAGVTRVSDLRKPQYFDTLPDEAKLEVKYSVSHKLPWEFAHEFISLMPKHFMALGSYRRKKQTLGDVDLVTTVEMSRAVRDFENSAKSTAKTSTKTSKYEIVGKFASGDTRTGYIVRYRGVYFKVDIFHAPKSQLPAATLHWTGSMLWNIRCRYIAKRKGYLLNEKGLFKDGKSIPVKSEEDILEIIGVKYLPPEERDH